MPPQQWEKPPLPRGLRTICHDLTRGPRPTGNSLDRLRLGWTASVAHAAPATLVCHLRIPKQSELRRPITAERFWPEPSQASTGKGRLTDSVGPKLRVKLNWKV